MKLFLALFRRAFLRTKVDRFDFDAGQLATMPDRAVIAFAPFVFERDHLFVFALLEDFGGNFGTGNERVAVRHLFTVGMKEHFAKRGGFARLDVQKIDIHRVTFGHTMLSPACLNNCVSHNREKL
jgi:hypothetical protein